MIKRATTFLLCVKHLSLKLVTKVMPLYDQLFSATTDESDWWRSTNTKTNSVAPAPPRLRRTITGDPGSRFTRPGGALLRLSALLSHRLCRSSCRRCPRLLSTRTIAASDCFRFNFKPLRARLCFNGLTGTGDAKRMDH